MKNTCIIIAGPTAVGKTDLAIELAPHYSAEIVSADSRQCYRELNIGVAKPSPQQLNIVPHHFINSHSITEAVTAAAFEKYALEKVELLFTKSKVVVMVGGTGLYIKAFAQGLDEVPAADESVRKKLMEDFENGGIRLLQDQIKAEDPLFDRLGEMQNPRRVMRALEVIRSSGKSIIEFHTSPAKQRDFNIIQIALEMPREELYQRINLRTQKMMEAGLLEEVSNLVASKDLPALQTVGYRELFEHLEGKISLDEAVNKISQNTRYYAKRQLTWFRNHPGYVFAAPDFNDVLAIIEKYK